MWLFPASHYVQRNRFNKQWRCKVKQSIFYCSRKENRFWFFFFFSENVFKKKNDNSPAHQTFASIQLKLRSSRIRDRIEFNTLLLNKTRFLVGRVIRINRVWRVQRCPRRGTYTHNAIERQTRLRKLSVIRGPCGIRYLSMLGRPSLIHVTAPVVPT